MDLEQRLRASLVAPDPGPTFTARVMTRVGRGSARRRGGFIVIGTVLVLAAVAAMLAWRMSTVQSTPVESATIPNLSDPGPAVEGPGLQSILEFLLSLFRTWNTGIAGDAVSPCAQTVNDATEFATLERNAANPVQAAEQSEDWFHAELGKLQRDTAGSRDPDFLTALLLLPQEARSANDPSSQAKLLELGVRATKSGSPLLAWHALRACAEAKQFCPIVHLEQKLLEADRQNAEAWALVATLRYERGDVAGALTAMQGAARAPTSTWYWTETIALIERSLATQTAIPFPDRPMNAFSTAASAALPSASQFKMCKVESSASRSWGEACLAFGTLRGEHNETEVARSIGYSIRVHALTALGDTERAAEVAAELALIRGERYDGSAASVAQLQRALIETDPARFHAYLGAIQKSGEEAGARMFLRQELPPLLERAGLIEREGARECVAEFFAPRAAVADTRSATAEQRIKAADKLYITIDSTTGGGSATNVRVGADGKITLPRVRGIAADGKTAVQLEREIAAMAAKRLPSPEVLVILIPSRSREELRLEFDNAWNETTERRTEPR